MPEKKTATYSEEIRYVWLCECGQYNEEPEDPQDYGNEEAVCENCGELYSLILE